MNIAVIELGSNINPINNKEKTLHILENKFIVLGYSDFIWTKPIVKNNFIDNIIPDYLNGAIGIETNLDFDNLKNELKNIEKLVGRIEREKYDNREIDLDIIIWNNSIIHNDYFERDFVKKTVDQVLNKIFQKLNHK